MAVVAGKLRLLVKSTESDLRNVQVMVDAGDEEFSELILDLIEAALPRLLAEHEREQQAAQAAGVESIRRSQQRPDRAWLEKMAANPDPGLRAAAQSMLIEED